MSAAAQRCSESEHAISQEKLGRESRIILPFSGLHHRPQELRDVWHEHFLKEKVKSAGQENQVLLECGCSFHPSTNSFLLLFTLQVFAESQEMGRGCLTKRQVTGPTVRSKRQVEVLNPENLSLRSKKLFATGSELLSTDRENKKK